MGIEGLLPLLKPIVVKSHIHNFAGKTVAIDASAWLYKGIYSCSWELATGIPTYGYLHFPLKMINMLLKHSVKPILVFDGLTLPLKENAIKKRMSDKVKNKELAEKYLAEGNKEQAASMFARSMSVKSHMIHTLMDVLNNMNVDYIVSPFEADAQIAYLCKENIADFAISEDSDLLVYGCTNLVLKLDSEGSCENITIDQSLWNTEYMKGVPEGPVKDVASLPKERFMELCIIAGCDYLNNIHGFAMRGALKMLKDYTLEETLCKIQYKKQFMGKVPDKYKESVERIKLQFLHGRVIDPRTYKMIEITPLPSTASAEDSEALGKILDPNVVEAYAKGLYSARKNTYRQRLTKEEVENVLKDMSYANKSRKFMENKKSLNDFTNELQKETKEIATKVVNRMQEERKEETKSSPQEAESLAVLISEENKKEPNNLVVSEIDSLEKELSAVDKKEKDTLTSVTKENYTLTPSLTKPNPFAKENVAPAANVATAPTAEPEENKKKTFYSFFQGDSLTQFFKRESKRFKEDNGDEFA